MGIKGFVRFICRVFGHAWFTVGDPLDPMYACGRCRALTLEVP